MIERKNSKYQIEVVTFTNVHLEVNTMVHSIQQLLTVIATDLRIQNYLLVSKNKSI